MKLLAHSPDGTKAVIAHDDGLPYDYSFGDIDTGTLIKAPATHMVPSDWHTDVHPDFATIDEIKDYLA
jgi:hypothetical protein